MRVYMRHARALKFCSKGVRAFCKKFNIDFADFIANGIDAQRLIDLNDDQAMKMVELAKQEFTK